MAPWVNVGAPKDGRSDWPKHCFGDLGLSLPFAVLMVEARATQVRPAVYCALTAEMPQI